MSRIDQILEAQHEIRKYSREAEWYLSPALEAEVLANWDLLSPLTPPSQKPTTVCGFPYLVTPYLPPDVLGVLYSGPKPLNQKRLQDAEPWQIVILKREDGDASR